MGEVAPFGDRRPDIPNATVGQALFAAIVDELRAEGIGALPPRVIATAAKQGKDALAAGVEPEMVLVGCMFAISQGKARYTAEIISDCVLAKAGKRVSTTEYRSQLDMISRSNQPAVQRFREVTTRISEQKGIEQ